ncbi:MAG: sugar transferase [Lachnospiraceae bacterium]|nr:sugar transferase [Lachnospiraceae bacterium]
MYPKVKRLLDLVVSGICIVIGAIPMLIVAIIVKIDSPGPAIFKQDRLGVGGKPFKFYKFRSMVVNAEHTGSGVYSGKGDSRITRVGRILRATSIDEVPQLFNIFKGEMSFIGPRPALTYHPWPYEEYTEHQKHMFDVRPGITGWAQINGRKEVEWPRRIEMNVWYVEHMSFLLDVKIFFKTLGKVFTNADNENTTKTAAAGNTAKEVAADQVAATVDDKATVQK